MKMTRMTILAAVVGLTATTFSGVAANAAAGPVQSPMDATQAKTAAVAVYNELSVATNPEQVYANLTVEERKALDGYFLPATTTETITLTQIDAAGKPLGAAKTFVSEAEAMRAVAASTSCWNGTSKVTEHSGLGNALWDTWTQGHWCGNGGTVTSASFTGSWSTIAAVGWRDAGQIGSGSGISGGQARMWSQRRMILGVGGWDVQTLQPCNRLNGNANASVSTTLSCSIV